MWKIFYPQPILSYPRLFHDVLYIVFHRMWKTLKTIEISTQMRDFIMWKNSNKLKTTKKLSTFPHYLVIHGGKVGGFPLWIMWITIQNPSI